MFESRYRQLNSKQKEAVDNIEGPVMVVAGPGTGKTEILTLRIANILKLTDTAPENILALTLTDSACSNMRRRLVQLIGQSGYRVVISTFHGFCNEIIKTYPEHFPRIIGSQSITDIEQIDIIESIVRDKPFKLLKSFGDPFFYVKDIISAINELKREGISVEDFNSLIEESVDEFKNIPDLIHQTGPHKGKMKSVYVKLGEQIEKNKELHLIYSLYENKLTELRYYDYTDMVMEVLKRIKTDQVLLSYLQENHQYILVDEHQDTNQAQNKVLELITNFHSSPNLFVVGDEKQSIFRFQGASIDNFFYFKKIYPEAKLIVLTDNYRSSQNILNQAESLISGLQPLKSYHKDNNGSLIEVVACQDQDFENYFIASSIRERINKEENIAILYRDNKDAKFLSLMLEKLGIPFVIESDDNLLKQSDVVKILTILKSIIDLTDNYNLAQALHVDFLDIDLIEVYKLIKKTDEKTFLIDLVKQFDFDLYEKLKSWQISALNDDLVTVLEKIISQSGLVNFLIKDINRLETVNSFFDEVKIIADNKPDFKLKEFLDLLQVVEKHNLNLGKNRKNLKSGKVRLMTVHKSKGLEFDLVYITGVYDGHFGGRVNRNKLKLLPSIYGFGLGNNINTDDDERRLFYVALTRAKKQVIITYPLTNSQGRELLPSKFIQELNPELISLVDPSLYYKEFEDNRINLLKPVNLSVDQKINQEWVNDIFNNQGLSVTALNNYLKCPWQYFYRNLIRLPEVKNKHLIYGTAVHDSLRDFFNQAREYGWAKDKLLSLFEYHLSNQLLKKDERLEILEKGLSSLGGWFDKYQSSWQLKTIQELNVKGVLLDDVLLVGKLDKIEFLNDKQVNVVDYKTGQPKSKNELIGKNKDSSGDYYRQLVFYKILLDLFDNGRYQMISGEIDFIEPTKSGGYKKEKFIINQDEVDELKNLILKTTSEIKNLSFWDKFCDDEECHYCQLRKLII